MSHFCVIVIGENVDEQLAPYHEFECTGIDEYIEEVDELEDLLKEYKTEKVRALKSPDGEIFSFYDDRFYREPTEAEIEKLSFGNSRGIIGTGSRDGISYTSKDWGDGKGHRGKVHEIPAGYEKIELEGHEQLRTFDEYIEYSWGDVAKLYPGQPRDEEHKYRFLEMNSDGEIVAAIRRTNPNAKWDWYVVGGRWTGYFPLKKGAKGELGRPGVFNNQANPNTADVARKGDIDFDRARAESEAQAREWFALWEKAFTKHGKPESWKSFLEKVDAKEMKIDEAREKFHKQPAIAEYKNSKDSLLGCPVGAFGFDKEAYVEAARAASLIPFAIVKDGKWHEKGSMGGWGIVSDARDEIEWVTEAAKAIDDLPDDTLLTIVDCHI